MSRASVLLSTESPRMIPDSRSWLLERFLELALDVAATTGAAFLRRGLAVAGDPSAHRRLIPDRRDLPHAALHERVDIREVAETLTGRKPCAVSELSIWLDHFTGKAEFLAG